jgi:pimeloyl-ACP methyl ester carboxylesterase
MNPGGPGGSGLGTFIENGMGSALSQGNLHGTGTNTKLSTFNITSWDPRGVGKSTNVTCTSNMKFIQDMYSKRSVYNSLPVEKQLEVDKEATRLSNESCLEKSPNREMVEHMDTVQNAHDLDLLRHLVGDKKLNYYGGSWGSILGATYTASFPDKVGKMVLDGVVPYGEKYNAITGFAINFSRIHEFRNVLDNALMQCVTDDTLKGICPFVGNADNVKDFDAELDDKIAELNSTPVVRKFYKYDDDTTPESTVKITGDAIVSLIHEFWNDKNLPTLVNYLKTLFTVVPVDNHATDVEGSWDAWDNLANALVAKNAVTRDVVEKADEYPPTVDTNGAISWVSCEDSSMSTAEKQTVLDEIDKTYSDMPAMRKKVRSDQLGVNSTCDGIALSVKPKMNYGNLTLPTILLVYSSYDFNTPPELIGEVEEQFASSITIKYDGAFHCAYFVSKDVAEAANIFFNTGVMPENGTTYPHITFTLPSPHATVNSHDFLPVDDFMPPFRMPLS